MTSIQIDIKDGLSSSVAIKGPCIVATTANITLSGEQTIDGVAVVTDDRVLVKDQTTDSENGIYIVDTGAWRRSKDFNKTKDIKTGTVINVVSGSVGSGWWEVTTTGDVTVGTTDIAFAQRLQPYDADLASWAVITRATGFDSFVATPSSANLRALLTDETGSGYAVFGTSPTFTTSLTMTSGVVLGANYMANYTGNLGLTTASLQSPLTTNAAFYLHGTTTTTNQNFLSQLELISDTVSNTSGGAVANDYHIEATANSGSVWASAGTVQLDSGFAFGTYSAFVHEAGINNLAGDYSDIGVSASLGVSLNGLGYQNSAAVYINNMQQYIVATSPTAAGSAVLTFSGGVPAWFKVGGVITNLTNPSVIPAGTTLLSKTATTITLSANVTGAGVATNDHIQIAQPLWYQGIKFAPYGVAQYSINDQSNSATVLNVAGSHALGIDFSPATLSSAAIRLGVGASQGITARFSGVDYAVVHADSVGRPVFGNASLGSQFDGTVGVGATPVANTAVFVAGAITGGAGNALGVNVTPTLSPASGAAGVFSQSGGTVNTGGNTIAGAYSAYLAAPIKTGGGTITTAYGLFVEAPTSGSTNYSIWAAGAVNFATTLAVTTSITSPLLLGGTGTGSTLTLQSTSGAGATDAISLKVGNNGAIEAVRVNTNGFVTMAGGSLGRGAPIVKTADFSVGLTENWLICNKGSTLTVTLPAPASFVGREITLKTIQAFTVVSASSNVVPLAGGAASTAILAATAGKWATLVSDGSVWYIMAGN